MTRPDNLLPMRYAIDRARIPEVEVRWIIVTDSNTVGEMLSPELWDDTKYISHPTNYSGASGNPQRNAALKESQGDYVYFLDDDNIIHPDLLRECYSHMLRGECIVVNQVNKENKVRLTASREAIKPTFIDTAQFLIPGDIARNYTWDVWDYCADGIYFSTIYKENKDKFVIVNKNLSYYNYLR